MAVDLTDSSKVMYLSMNQHLIILTEQAIGVATFLKSHESGFDQLPKRVT
jgi:hypothetical protein